MDTVELETSVKTRTSLQLLEDQGSSKSSSIDGLAVQITPEFDDHCMVMEFSNVASEEKLGILNGLMPKENRLNRGEAICLSIVALVLIIGGWAIVSFSYY